MPIHNECMERGVNHGWWPSYDDRGPHPWPVFYILRDKTLRRPQHGMVDYYGSPTYTTEVIEFEYTSQLLAYIGVFDSVSDARKAGYANAVTIQELWFKKGKQGCTHLFIDED